MCTHAYAHDKLLVWVWNILVTYHLMYQTSLYMSILHEYVHVRMLGCMSTLNVHVMHTQHTHTGTKNTMLRTYLFRARAFWVQAQPSGYNTSASSLHWP